MMDFCLFEEKVSSSMEKPICIIEKNSTQDVRVQLSEYRGRHYVDVRVFVVIDAVKRGPTRKGVTLAVGKLPELIAGLQAAEREAQAAGLLEGSETTATAPIEATEAAPDSASEAGLTIIGAG